MMRAARATDVWEHLFKPGSRECRVCVGEDALQTLPELGTSATALVAVADQRVAEQYGAQLGALLADCGPPVHEWTVPGGESTKSLWHAECLYDFLASRGIDRGSVMVAFGGGSIGDLAGFAAATWMRGIPWINCPTTLLAAVDAGIGGKTGLNHAGRKNCIGAFHQPRAVLVDTSLLRSLDAGQVGAGLAESLKHALIADPEFLDWHVAHAAEVRALEPRTIEQLIRRNILIKSAVVAEDECDTSGARARLNFGHTVGHALEVLSGHRLRHGEAVALGMQVALYLSADRGLLAEEALHGILQVFQVLELPTKLESRPEPEALVAVLRQDKKALAGRPGFVLLSGVGEVHTGQVVEETEIIRAVDRLS